MRKFLFLAVLILFSFFLFLGIFYLKKQDTKKAEQENNFNPPLEVPLDKRPFVSLIPSKDGHFLNLKVEKIKIEASNLEYQLLYKTENQVLQGVPGVLDLGGKTSISEEILLGSESSGKYRFDEGVKEGSLNLYFRDKNGKLVARFETDFRMFSQDEKIFSSDEKLSLKVSAMPRHYFLIVMHTVGLPDFFEGEISNGPYGVFFSQGIEAQVEAKFDQDGKVFFYKDNSWNEGSKFNGNSSVLVLEKD